MIRRFWNDERGAALVEMAFIAPAIAFVALISFGVWDAAGRHRDMNTGLDAASQYYMNGGADDATARTVALDAWGSKPADASVSATRSYRCGGTASAADALCSGSKLPAVYVRLSAQGSTQGAMFTPTIIEERSVRVR